MSYQHRPVKLDEAAAFIAKHHRHSKPLRRHRFSIGVEGANDGAWGLIGVVSVDNCSSSWSKRYNHFEIRRVCVIGNNKNLSSYLLARAGNASFEMGALCLVTYTRPWERGSSLLGNGWLLDHYKIDADGGGLLRWIKARHQDDEDRAISRDRLERVRDFIEQHGAGRHDR